MVRLGSDFLKLALTVTAVVLFCLGYVSDFIFLPFENGSVLLLTCLNFTLKCKYLVLNKQSKMTIHTFSESVEPTVFSC